MSRFIIVKYADENFPSGKASIGASRYGSATARECGIFKSFAASREEAAVDLSLMVQLNPSVGYGIVEVEDNEDAA
mgnify:CR=1 FL=1